MKREFLEKLGIEKDVIDQVMAEHGIGVEAGKARVAELEGQIKERDSQLEALKRVNAGELEEEIKHLQEENRVKAEEYAAQIARMQKEAAVRDALHGDAHDPADIVALLDIDALELGSDGKVVELEQRIDELKELKPYLFRENPGVLVRGAVPAAPMQQREREPAKFIMF